MARHVDLEAALIADPNDLDTYAVYADWLDSVGDPRAELVRLQLEAEAAPSPERTQHVDAMIARLQPEVLGTLATRILKKYAMREAIVWRRGFVDQVRLYGHDGSEPLPALIAEILNHPACALLRALDLDARHDQVGPDEVPGVIDTLVERARALTWLHLWSTSDVPNLATLSALPRLWHLSIHIDRRDHGQSSATVRAIGRAPWSHLRSISLDVGTDGAMPDDLAPLLSRTDVPLSRLVIRGDRRSTFCSAVCRMIAESPHATTLEHVDISVGNLAPADYKLLVEHRWRFPANCLFRVPSRTYSERLSKPH